MLLSKKVFFLCILCSCLPLTVQAQSEIIKSAAIAKKVIQPHQLPISLTPWRAASRKAIQKTGRSYMVPNKQIGREILRGVNQSIIGTPEHVRFNTIATNTKFLGESISRNIAKKIVKPTEIPPVSFSGFNQNFPAAWADFRYRHHSKGGHLTVLLDAAFGDKPQFMGHFVKTFDEVIALAHSPIEVGYTSVTALKQAIAQGKELKTGFVVIRVAGNARRPKDTLILDLAHDNYISFNSSQSRLWAGVLQERTPSSSFQLLDPTLMDRRATQGIILRTDGFKYPKHLGVSIDGEHWDYYPLYSAAIRTAKETETALNIWTAWIKGYYILYQPGQRVLFSQGIGQPLFTSPYQVESHSSTR